MTELGFFEHIQNHFEKDLPFVIYRKPRQFKLKAVLQSDSELYIAKTFSESGFVFSPFKGVQENIFFPLDKSEVVQINEFSDIKFKAETIESEISLVEKNHHLQIVKKAVETISTTNLQKVVLSRCETVRVSDSFIIIFKRLLTLYKNAFVHCWFHPKVGLWLGATPETLISVNNQNYKTMALAGTISNNGMVDWQEKEQYAQTNV